ncbi:MAG: addiction module toxin, HicA family [Bryobacterales bacterium]|nr:addiction module toxin, HicA family [Bryobacterales bacterium]
MIEIVPLSVHVGGRHAIFVNPANGSKTPVPRHTEIDNRLACKICRQLAVAPIR